MAREHGLIWISIWRDEDFRRLDSRTQWLYFALISQWDMSPCGVQPYQPNRWAQLAPDMTPKQIHKAIHDLEKARLLIVDRATDELLVRSHVRHDRPMRVPNSAKAVVRWAARIESDDLRKALIVELRRLREDPEFCDYAGWKVPEVAAFMFLAKGAPE